MTTQRNLYILQYNLNKNRIITDSILNHPTSHEITILALQEQYWSTYNSSSLTHQSWTLVEPSSISEIQPRAVLYINKTVLLPSVFRQVPLPFSDVVAVAIHTAYKPILIVNVYNPRETNKLLHH